MRPDSGQGNCPDGCERLRDEVVDVIEHIGGQRADLDRPASRLQGCPQVENLHWYAARIHEALQFDARRPAREAKIGPHAEDSQRVVGAEREQMTWAKCERSLRTVSGETPSRVEIGIPKRGDEPVGISVAAMRGLTPAVSEPPSTARKSTRAPPLRRTAPSRCSLWP